MADILKPLIMLKGGYHEQPGNYQARAVLSNCPPGQRVVNLSKRFS
jgi:hypothetical protein